HATTDIYTPSLHDALPICAIASASPKASIAVVEAVGARPRLQASLTTEQSSATSAASASVETSRVAADDLPALFSKTESPVMLIDRKSTRLNSSHRTISYA